MNSKKTWELWSAPEIEILQREYGRLGVKGIMKLLPSRTKSAIATRARMLGVTLLPETRGYGLSKDLSENLTELEKAYLAGLFDGEGCIHIATHIKRNHSATHYSQLHLIVSNTNKQVMDYLTSKLGGNLIIRKPYKKRQRSYYMWRIYSQKAGDLLEILLPYLIIKKEEALLAIEFQSTLNYEPKKLSPETIIERDEIAEKLKQLKGRIH